MSLPKAFPILQPVVDKYRFVEGAPTQVYWSELNDERARKNHCQSLIRLAERGGLSPSEIVCNIMDIDWRTFKELRMSMDEVIERVKTIAVNE